MPASTIDEVDGGRHIGGNHYSSLDRDERDDTVCLIRIVLAGLTSKCHPVRARLQKRELVDM